LQVRSAEEPFSRPALAQHALDALVHADAMGLLPPEDVIDSLDAATMRRLLEHVSRAGIFIGVYADIGDGSAWDPAKLEALVARLNEALEESPVPACEWPRLVEVLGGDLLGALLGISASSLRRYRQQARTTPDDIAARLHFLALVVGDLAGAYNDVGIRRWFERPREALDQLTPASQLAGDWKPTDPGPRKVRELARALTASPVT
jgi:hypothetical protein